jgi:hypothetical protein
MRSFEETVENDGVVKADKVPLGNPQLEGDAFRRARLLLLLDTSLDTHREEVSERE